MKKIMRASVLFGVAGMLFMLAGLFASLNGKPCAAYLACGTIFLFVGAQKLGRERAAEKEAARAPDQNKKGDKQ